MALVHALESGAGRVARGGLGVVMVGVGTWLGVQVGGAWWVLAAIGLVPLAAGAFGACLAAPLVHEPLRTSRTTT